MRKPTSKPVFRQDSATERQEIMLTNNLISDDDIIAEAETNKAFASDEVTIPFLKILQPLSPSVQEGTSDYIPSAKPGMFYNTATEQLFDGKIGIAVVPITHQRNFTEWVSRAQGGGFVKNWGEGLAWQEICEPEEREAYIPVTKSGHTILKSYFHYVYVVELDTGSYNPCVFSFAGTQIKRSRRWSSLMANAMIATKDGPKRAAHSYYVYKAITEIERNDKGTWYAPRISAYTQSLNGKNTWLSVRDIPNGGEIWVAAKEFRKSLMEGTIQSASMAAPDFEREANGKTIDGDEVPF